MTNNEFSWVQEFYDRPEHEYGVHLTSKYMSKLIDIGANRKHLDRFLKQVELKRLGTVLLITTLRTPSSYRSELKNWCSTRDKVHRILTNRGYDADKLLRGLY